MTITEKVKEVLTENGNLPYVFGSMMQVNKMMDRLHRAKSFPIAIALQPVDGTLSVADVYGARGRDTAHIMVGYADSIKLDYEPERVQGQVDALKERCLRCLHTLATCGQFDYVSEAAYSVMFDALDANMVIVLMDFSIREAEGICLDN